MRRRAVPGHAKSVVLTEEAWRLAVEIAKKTGLPDRSAVIEQAVRRMAKFHGIEARDESEKGEGDIK